jgi:hypothetical protein
VKAVMTAHVFMVSSAPLRAAVAIMIDKRIGCLPVVEDGMLVGLSARATASSTWPTCSTSRSGRHAFRRSHPRNEPARARRSARVRPAGTARRRFRRDDSRGHGRSAGREPSGAASARSPPSRRWELGPRNSNR